MFLLLIPASDIDQISRIISLLSVRWKKNIDFSSSGMPSGLRTFFEYKSGLRYIYWKDVPTNWNAGLGK